VVLQEGAGMDVRNMLRPTDRPEEDPAMPCECGLGPSTEECCGRFLSDEAKPETAEALMRSRYTAYARQDIDYVIRTHDPKTVKDTDKSYAAKWAKDATWDDLEIVETDQGGPEDEEGVVEFKAR